MNRRALLWLAVALFVVAALAIVSRATWWSTRGHAPVDTNADPLAESVHATNAVDDSSVQLADVSATKERMPIGADSPTTLEAIVPVATIGGVVVDESGSPVAGIAILAKATRSGLKAKATSVADGRFVLALRSDEEHRLALLDSPWFERVLAQSARRENPVAAGTRDVRVVVRRLPPITFRVVDGATDAPLESYDLRIGDDLGRLAWDVGSTPEYSTHPGGTVTLPRGSRSNFVVVAAPDHAPYEAPIESDVSTTDVPASDVHVLRLGPPSSLHGRVVRGQKPVGGAWVTVRRDLNAAEDASMHSGQSDVTAPGPLGVFVGRDRRVRSDEHGQFRVDDLAPGTYVLEVRARGALDWLERSRSIEAEQDVDVGEIALGTPGTVRGRVHVAAYDTPQLFQVRLEAVAGVHESRTPHRGGMTRARDGSFEFENVYTGTYDLTWVRIGLDADCVDGRVVRFELADGEARTIDVDASAAAPCRLDVTLRAHERPVRDFEVYGLYTTHSGSSSRCEKKLGDTDDQGKLSVEIDGDARVRLYAQPRSGILCAVSPQPLVAVPGGAIRWDAEVCLGTLELVLPAGSTLPDRCYATIFREVDRDLEVVFVGGGPENGSAWDKLPLRKQGEPLRADMPCGEYAGLLRIAGVKDAGSSPMYAKDSVLPAWAKQDVPVKFTISSGQTTRIAMP